MEIPTEIDNETENNTLFFETPCDSLSSVSFMDMGDIENQREPDVEVMCHIRDLLENGFPEENKGDPSFKIAYKQVVEYIARNCHHVFVEDWVDTDVERGGTPVEYCELCMTLRLREPTVPPIPPPFGRPG